MDRNPCCRLCARHFLDEVPVDAIKLEVEGSVVNHAVRTDLVGLVEGEGSERVPVDVEIPPNVMEPEGPSSNLLPSSYA